MALNHLIFNQGDMRSVYAARIILLLIFFGCQKGDIQNVTPDPDPGLQPPVYATARLILPEGSVLSETDLTFINGHSQSTVVGDTFAIDTVTASNTFSFIVGNDNRVYLAKYYVPGSSDHDISAYSTALALLISSPLAGSLTPEGRASLVQFITGTGEFAALQEEIEKNILQGIPITDINNANLREALLAAFERMSAGGTVGDTTVPLIISRSARKITIRNNGAANTYVAGVYKDGNKEGELTVIGGTSRTASSLSQAVSGLYLPVPQGESKEIELRGDGKFQIRIRSGSTTTVDGSDEHALAAKLNLLEVSWSVAERFLPGGESCMNEVKKQLFDEYQQEVPQYSGSVNEVSNATYALARKIITDNISKMSGCYDASLFSRYAETIISYLDYLSAVSSSASGAINVSPRLFHLYYNQPQFDLCYTVEGDDVADCNTFPSDTYVYQAFHAVPGTTIGATIEFRLKFTGTQISGTARSISFDYGSGEQTVPVSGTLIGSTMTLFIHVDNQVVPELVDCIPQPTPNCPNCRYTGDHVVQDWEIVGTVNENHSTYSAEYTRMITYTSLLVNKDCNTSIVVDEAEESGALSY